MNTQEAASKFGNDEDETLSCPTAMQKVGDAHEMATGTPLGSKGFRGLHDNPLNVVYPALRSGATQNDGDAHDTATGAAVESTVTGELHDVPS